MGNSWALLLIVAPPALVALAVARDKRSGRGYGLGVLAVGTLVLTLWGFGAVLQATQLASASAAGGLDLEVVVVAIVYVASGVYVALALTLGAIVETVIARQWWWLGLLALGTLVLTLWGFGAVLQATQLASASAAGGLDLEVAVVAIVYVASGVYVALALTVGAIVETVIARQWWWLGIVAIVSVVPAVIIFTSPPELVPNMFATLGLPRGAVSLVALLPPALVTFVYAIVRSIRRPIPL